MAGTDQSLTVGALWDKVTPQELSEVAQEVYDNL